MCSIDLEVCEVWHQQWVKRARKAHECDCCDGVIRPGESYERHFSVFEGGVNRAKVCRECHEAREEFLLEHGQVGQPERFADDLRECFGEEAREFWGESDRRWRALLAGILRRGRAASRVVNERKGEEG